MMTLRQAFSSIALAFLLFGCASIKLKKVHEGHNLEGKHSRALFDLDGSFVVGGQDGIVSVFNETFGQIVDSVEIAEDIRDAHMLSDGSIVLVNSGDLGRMWKVSRDLKMKVLTYDRAGLFIDGVDFWDEQNGIAYADPVNGRFIILRTGNGGEVWNQLDFNLSPKAKENEGGFAASGTGIATLGTSTIMIATGMADTARILHSSDRGMSWTVKNTPMKAGDSYGIYSMYFWSETEGIIIGGSYLKPEDNDRMCFYTSDGGDSWQDRSDGLTGYCSCIHGKTDGSFIVATGRAGTYYTTDQGKSWEKLLDEKFYSVRVSSDRIYFSGKNGRVVVYEYQQ